MTPAVHASRPPSLHGAGGVGGLLAVEDLTGGTGSGGTGVPPVDYLYLYDANGNVSDLVDSPAGSPTIDGSPIAHYEYDPYGNAVVATGDYAAVNPFRFSTKWLDAETGQHYYGYRLLDPPIGRWMNRDPIGDKGGSNLYSVGANSLANHIDPDGRTIVVRFCKNWIRSDGVILDLGDLVMRGTSLACQRLRDLQRVIHDPRLLQCVSQPPDPISLSSADVERITNEIDKIRLSACDDGGRDIQCRCDWTCRRQSGELQTPYPYVGVPILVCTNRLKDQEATLLDPNKWIHEFQRPWMGDPEIDWWDEIFQKLGSCLRAQQ